MSEPYPEPGSGVRRPGWAYEHLHVQGAAAEQRRGRRFGAGIVTGALRIIKLAFYLAVAVVVAALAWSMLHTS